MNEATNIKILAKETMIYGLSSIIGKFLNWLLVPLYTYVLAQQSDYGIVTNLYAWTALLLVILTYGMETGFFRFANKPDTNPSQVYTTTLICIGFTSTLFAVLMCLFCHPVAAWLGYPTHSEFISLLSIVVAMDAFASIPFAYLRYRKRPIAFAILKLLFVFLNIAFNLFFLVLCPKIQDAAWIAAWYQPDYGVGYVFVANIISTALQTLILLPFARPEKNNDTPAATTRAAHYDNSVSDNQAPLDKRSGLDLLEPLAKSASQPLATLVANLSSSQPTSPLRGESEGAIFSWPLLRQILAYSLPLLVLGICGIMNQTLDRIIFPFLYTAPDAQTQLGIYGACFKVAMVMMMFTQAFRYAYEPFVFAKHKDKQSVEAYADAMKYYIIFSYLILLAMIVYLPLLRHIIAPSYWEGLKVVPIVLWTYIFQGIYFNLSFWYKLTDQTRWGAYFSIIGLVATAVLQILFVPRMGYMASAGASTISYLLVMILSYLIGRKYLSIPYDLRRIGIYTLLTLGLLAIYYALPLSGIHLMALGTGLLLLFLALFWKLDLKILIRKN